MLGALEAVVHNGARTQPAAGNLLEKSTHINIIILAGKGYNASSLSLSLSVSVSVQSAVCPCLFGHHCCQFWHCHLLLSRCLFVSSVSLASPYSLPHALLPLPLGKEHSTPARSESWHDNGPKPKPAGGVGPFGGVLLSRFLAYTLSLSLSLSFSLLLSVYMCVSMAHARATYS